MGSTTSWRINSKLDLGRRWATLCFWLVKKLSRQMTSWPWATRRSQRWEPRKPAPPVTRMRFNDEVAIGFRGQRSEVRDQKSLVNFAFVVFNDFCQTFLEGNFGRPVEDLLGAHDVGAAVAGVVVGAGFEGD